MSYVCHNTPLRTLHKKTCCIGAGLRIMPGLNFGEPCLGEVRPILAAPGSGTAPEWYRGPKRSGLPRSGGPAIIDKGMPASSGIMRRFRDTPWGCFRTIVFTPLQTPCSDTAPPAYLSQKYPSIRASLSGDPSPIGPAGCRFARQCELRLNGVLGSTHRGAPESVSKNPQRPLRNASGKARETIVL